MGYRGLDLDLRTPQASNAAHAETVGAPDAQGHHGARPPAYRSGPIWVDDIVLVCANHAFDVALAHRAAEVRLEHLLYAMTRVDPAADALESRGVRVAPLRRDSAVFIASEVPIGFPEGGGSPRRSHELEEVLRVAGAHSARSSQPASVEDVLQVLLDFGSEFPGAALLMRHVPRNAREFWSIPAPARMPSYQGDARFAEPAEPVRPRNSSTAVDQPLAQGMLDRVSQLEQTLSDRLAAIEAGLPGAARPAPDLQLITDRLDVIEEALLSREGETAIQDKLRAFEEALAAERTQKSETLASLNAEVRSVADVLRADIKALAGELGDITSSAAVHQAAVTERLQTLASDLQQHRIELGSGLGDHLTALSSALDGQTLKHAEAHTAYAGELDEVHEALMKLNANQHTLAGSIDQWRGNETGDIHLLNARVGALQEESAKQVRLLETLSERIDALSKFPVQPPALQSPALLMPKREGWRYWLFGTDDWIKASWPYRSRKE